MVETLEGNYRVQNVPSGKPYHIISIEEQQLAKLAELLGKTVKSSNKLKVFIGSGSLEIELCDDDAFCSLSG